MAPSDPFTQINDLMNPHLLEDKDSEVETILYSGPARVNAFENPKRQRSARQILEDGFFRNN